MSLLILVNFKHFVAQGSGTSGVGEGGEGVGFNAEAYRKAVEARAHKTSEKTNLEIIRELSKPEEVSETKETRPDRRKKKRYAEPQVEFKIKPKLRARETREEKLETPPVFEGYLIPPASRADIEARKWEEEQRRKAREERRIELEAKLLAAQENELRRIAAEREFTKLLADEEELVSIIGPVLVRKIKERKS